MALSESQLQWLKTSDLFRVILMEASYLSGGQSGSETAANYPFISEPSDTPSNTAYADLIATVPSFSRRLGTVLFGQSVVSRGDVVLRNNGELDSWLTRVWSGQAIKLFIGDPSWNKDEFAPILFGICAGLRVKSGRLSLQLKDKAELLDKDFSGATVASGADIGKPIPICYGQCFNVEPVLIDSATSKYQVHTGAVKSIVARSSGLSIAITPDLVNGTFTLNTALTGRLTCDVEGENNGANYLSKAGEVVNHILLNHAGLTAGEIDDVHIWDKRHQSLCFLHSQSETQHISRLHLRCGLTFLWAAYHLKRVESR